MWYMRYQFEYFGLKAPQWMALTKQIHDQLGIPEGDALRALVDDCFSADQREMQYFALQTVEKVLKKQGEEFIDMLETLIVTKSWWDTVDWIAKLTGIHFRRFPHLIIPITGRWMQSGNIWLQRVCLIFQLQYKDKTDQALLFGYILQVAGSKEFFLQKGAGWALRQYARSNPEAVRAFIAQHSLPALTRREGLKHLK